MLLIVAIIPISLRGQLGSSFSPNVSGTGLTQLFLATSRVANAASRELGVLLLLLLLVLLLLVKTKP